ncbi:MAG: hypothetical protein WA364_10720 [Candidatus Nitrosopolaris sp.]
MSSNKEDDTSSAPGGETSADYMISESGKQSETTKGKKSGFDSVTDKIKEKVKGAGKSIKEGAASTVGRDGDDDDDKKKDLDSAQAQGEIGETASDPTTSGPTENLREKAVKNIDESEDSEEPV